MAHSAWILRACINGDRLLSLEAKSEVNKLPTVHFSGLDALIPFDKVS
jgi:hypothetical protein